MRHHQHKKDFPFFRLPRQFNKNTEKSVLQYCLGGTLYMPGTRHIIDKILGRELEDLTSMVMCFEDAIDVSDLQNAEKSVLAQLSKLALALATNEISIDDVPLIFLRVRHIDQFKSFTDKLDAEQANLLTGFVFPKFSMSNALLFLDHLERTNRSLNTNLYGMPILEGTSIAHHELRLNELSNLKQTLDVYKDRILNVRVGGTDLSSIFGVRRGMNSSIYDILTVKDCLSDILNYFNRAEDGYTVSGPVWEYFLADNKDDIDEVVAENMHHSLINRNPILNEAIDGLLREIVLDKANGFIGKTIIHPSHLKYINSMLAVTREEYEDAMQILGTNGGVVKSVMSNKMNEVSPHRNWALRISRCADAFGVIENESCYLKLCLA